ncbi:MAG: exostosin domain-containing protein [Limisphaerales bacterium]
MPFESLSVYIAPCDDSATGWRGFYQHVLKLHDLAREKRHRIVNDPATADLILLTDSNDDDLFLTLRKNALVKQYPENVFTIYEGDFPQRFLPGIYTSMPESIWNLGRFATGSYSYCYAKHGNTVDLLKDKTRSGEIFFSFIGRGRAKVREALFKQNFNRSDVVIEDSSKFNYFTSRTNHQVEQQLHYLDVSMKSRFMLCPRGQGTASIRLFDAMQMGVAPVIISDKWIRPHGPDWKNFAVFVAEKDIARLPELIAPHDSRWREMGQLAREAWDEFFRADEEFNYIVESMARIKAERTIPERLMRLTWMLILGRVHLRRSLSRLKNPDSHPAPAIARRVG